MTSVSRRVTVKERLRCRTTFGWARRSRPAGPSIITLAVATAGLRSQTPLGTPTRPSSPVTQGRPRYVRLGSAYNELFRSTPSLKLYYRVATAQGICLKICFYTGNSLRNTGNVLKFKNLTFVVNFELANWEME